MKTKLFILLTIIILMITTTLWGAVLIFRDYFVYTAGTDLIDNGWTSVGGTGGIPIVSPGLTYICTGIIQYPPAIPFNPPYGNAVSMGGTTEDDYKTFTERTSGAVYMSFLFNSSDATTTGDDFIAFGPNPHDGNYYGRVWAKKVDTNLEFSASVGETTSGYTANNYNFDETYLLVVKYEFISGEANDEVSLFVFPSSIGHDSEPETPTYGPVTGSVDAPEIGGVLIKQGDFCPTAEIDDIRVGTGWDKAPLPVTLSTFTAHYINNSPMLCWETQSETDNLGWYVHRNTVKEFASSQVISNMIEGYGTTSQPNSYVYEDTNDLEIDQTYYYWLESIDYSGVANHYDRIAEITIPNPQDPGQTIIPPVAYEISVDPNPVMSSTHISFVMDQPSVVSLAIYDARGKRVKSFGSKVTFVENESVKFNWGGRDDAGRDVPNGVYLYSIKVNGKDYATKKLILMK